MSHAHKEFKAQTKLPSFYTSPCKTPLKIQLDDTSRRLILKGNSKSLNLFNDEVKASLGQRYVMIAVLKDDTAHLRAIPSFEFIEDTEKRNTLAEKAAKFFSCTIEEIAFPTHVVWTGVVHEQLISLIKKREPRLLENAKIIGFSMTKINDKYYWLNRSVFNRPVFLPDPLASACFAFDERSFCADFKPGRFDLFYHLTRSIPRDFFLELTNAAIEQICIDEITPLSKSMLDDCINFSYQAKWQFIQELFEKDKDSAKNQIQHMLMRNLFLLTMQKCSRDDRDKALYLLIAGFDEAKKLAIKIDLNYVPPEFADCSKTGFANCIFMIFEAELSAEPTTQSIAMILKLLSLSDIPVYSVDQNNLLEKLLCFIEKIPQEEKKSELIKAVTNKHSAIGQRLLKIDSSARFFAATDLQLVLKLRTAVKQMEFRTGSDGLEIKISI